MNRPIDAVVDTGSPWTVVSTNDLLSTRLPLHTMQKGPSLQLAGFKFFRYAIPNASLSFKTETGELFKGVLSTMGALVPTKLDKKTLDDVRNIPNIIGHDFLEENKLGFYFNVSTKTAYLEIP